MFQNGLVSWSAVALLGGVVASAGAVEAFVFENADSADVSQLLLQVDVADAGGGMVDLIFRNLAGSSASNVANVYVEANALLAGGLVINGAGVSFAPGGSPGNPPGSINGFSTAWNGTFFSAGATSPMPNVNAINPGESLTLRFSLINATAADVDAALGSGAFRAAMHVRGLENGASVWAVTPAPGTMALAAFGGLLASRRRR